MKILKFRDFSLEFIALSWPLLLSETTGRLNAKHNILLYINEIDYGVGQTISISLKCDILTPFLQHESYDVSANVRVYKTIENYKI